MLARVCFLGIITFSTIIFSININKPFIGHHDFNSAFFSSIARTLVKNDIASTKLGLANGYGQDNQSSDYDFYTHNVPLHPWILSLSFLFFGVGEWQARSVSIIFSVFSTVLVFLISKKILSVSAAFCATLLFVLSAMMMYFSSNVFPEPMAIALSLASFYFYIRWLENKRNTEFILLILTSALSLFVVWGSYFLIPFIVLHYLFNFRKKNLSKILILIILPFIMFLAFLLHINFITGSINSGSLLEILLVRLNFSNNSSISVFSILQFLQHEASIAIAYYSKTTIALAFVWLIMFANSVFQKETQQIKKYLLILPLLFWGLSYPIVFSNASYIHDYFLIYMSPFIAISSAHVVWNILTYLKSKNIYFFQKKTFTIFSLIILIIIPVVQFLQVKDFTNALLNSQNSKQGLTLGSFLNNNTRIDEKILIMSQEFNSYYGVFTDYYADRNIDYIDIKFKDKKVIYDYNYIVTVDERPVDGEVIDYLTKNFEAEKIDNFNVYKIFKSDSN